MLTGIDAYEQQVKGRRKSLGFSEILAGPIIARLVAGQDLQTLPAGDEVQKFLQERVLGVPFYSLDQLKEVLREFPVSPKSLIIYLDKFVAAQTNGPLGPLPVAEIHSAE